MRRSVAGWIPAALAISLAGCVAGGAIPGSGSGVPARFAALGTEPFWAAEVDGEVLIYKTPENQQGERAILARRVRGGNTELSGILSGQPLALRIGVGPCSDGMSDTVYAWSAELRIGRQLLKGCAKPR